MGGGDEILKCVEGVRGDAVCDSGGCQDGVVMVPSKQKVPVVQGVDDVPLGVVPSAEVPRCNDVPEMEVQCVVQNVCQGVEVPMVEVPSITEVPVVQGVDDVPVPSADVLRCVPGSVPVQKVVDGACQDVNVPKVEVYDVPSVPGDLEDSVVCQVVGGMCQAHGQMLVERKTKTRVWKRTKDGTYRNVYKLVKSMVCPVFKERTSKQVRRPGESESLESSRNSGAAAGLRGDKQLIS